MILSSLWRRILGMSDKPKIVDALGAYQASNILGTVSQSGGIPTGAIIERGSNANGDYVKYADGTAFCWNSGISVGPTSSASGNVFSGASVTAVTFPITFSALGGVCCTPNFSNRWIGGASSVSTTGFSTLPFSSTSSATNVSISYVAFGRWF